MTEQMQEVRTQLLAEIDTDCRLSYAEWIKVLISIANELGEST